MRLKTTRTYKDIKLVFGTTPSFPLRPSSADFDGAVIADNCERELAQQQCQLFMQTAQLVKTSRSERKLTLFIRRRLVILFSQDSIFARFSATKDVHVVLFGQGSLRSSQLACIHFYTVHIIADVTAYYIAVGLFMAIERQLFFTANF